MNINFSEIPEQNLVNFKGGEKSAIMQIFNDENNKIMRGRLVPGASIGMHRHEGNSEIIYVLQGKGITICSGEQSPAEAGMVLYCPQGHEHTLINNGTEDLIFLGIVPEHK